MPYCPVLVQLTEDMMKFFKKGTRYLLQVWDQNNDKIYELPLQCINIYLIIKLGEIQMWNIFFDYFVFKLREPDENFEYFYIVNLKKKNGTILVPDFTKLDSKRKDSSQYKFIAYENNNLYVASDDHIKILRVKDDLDPDEKEQYEVMRMADESEVSTIVMDRMMTKNNQIREVRIHGFFINKEMTLQSEECKETCVLVALETSSNQIDLNTLHLLTDPGAENFNYEFRQFRPILPRQTSGFDQIRKFQLVIHDNGVSASAAVRESGAIDFYHDGMLCLSKNPEYDKDYHCSDVEISFDETFVKTQYIGQDSLKQDEGTIIRGISHDLLYTQSLSQSRSLSDDYMLSHVFYQRIKSHCKIYTGFVFLKTYIFVAHGNILSLYDILKERFTNHIQFDHEINQVFRSLAEEHDDQDAHEHQEFTICVLLENGSLKFLTKEIGNESEEVYLENPKMEQNVGGKIIQFDQDRDDNAWTFILVRCEGDYLLKCLHDCKIKDISTDFPQGLKITQTTNFVFLFSPKNVTEVLVHNTDMLSIYEISYNHEEDKVSILAKESRLNAWKDPSKPDDGETPFIGEEDDLHAAIRIGLDGIMLLADHTYFYVMNFAKQDAPPSRYKQMCSGLYLSDHMYMYTLSHKNTDTGTSSGFRLYDIGNCIAQVQKWGLESQNADGISNNGLEGQGKPKELMSYLLQSVQVGCQCMIDFSHQNQRLVYQSSYDRIEVVPVLHRNTIAFVGMSEREDYLATRVVNDSFIALSKQNILTTWDIVTGKMKKEFKLPKTTGEAALSNLQDFSEWEIYCYNKNHQAYKQDWAQQVLLVRNNDINELIDDSQFYDPQMIAATMKNQVSFLKKLPKKLKEFKLIEIKDETTVKEHFSYVFPFYGGAEQHMYFNNDQTLMFERLLGGRCFIYRRTEDKKNRKRVLWEQVLRFSQFPADLLEATQYPYIFNPSFSKYLDIDRKAKSFMIKDTFTQDTLFIIPDFVMNAQEEQQQSVAARFQWTDDSTIKYINLEGIERRIDITNGCFKELSFNVVPLFQELYKDHLDQKNHHYIQKIAAPITDTLQRLKIKYQAYKSAFYLDNNQDAKCLYPNLITVDYTLEGFEGRYVADLSFSFLHWNLMEKLESGQITVDQIDQNQFQKLVYNILPGGDTIFHRLADKSRGAIITEILRICHPNQQKAAIPACVTHVPFLENFDKSTPITILDEKGDYRTINTMLLYLSGYGIDHHSRAIVKSLPICVERECQNLNIYLLSRLIQTQECKKLTKGNLQDHRDPPGVTASKLLMSSEDEEIVNKFETIQSDLHLQFFDMPELHEFDNNLSNSFFSQLAATEDMNLFDNKGVKMLIEYRWPLVREYVVKKLLIPFIAFLCTFSFYMSTVYENRQESNPFYQLLNYLFMGLLAAECLYFLGIEIQQLIKNGVSYFSSVWNYLDLIPPIILLIFLPLVLVGTFDPIDGVKQNQTLEASLQATVSLLLWLKLLYFLRIFQSTGYLIKIIISVCVDIRYFMFILFLTIMAFGDSLRAMSTSNLRQHMFIEYWWQSFAYVYRMILGDFSTEETVLQGGPIIQDAYSNPNNGLGKIGPYFTMGLFYLCTVLNMIIMLNLLIAIISESFAKINSQKQQANYQEKCDIMAENTYLVPLSRQRHFCERNRYVLIATDIQKEMDNQPRDSTFMLRETYRKISEANKTVEKKITDQIAFLQSESEKLIIKKIDKILEDNEELLENLEIVLDPKRNDKDN